MMLLKFLNDVVKPFDELNSFLTERLAVQPELSDVTYRATTLATKLSHYPERASSVKKKRELEQNCSANQLICDIADFDKHGSLRDPFRNNSINVIAYFEGNDRNEFRFIRNAIMVQHERVGSIDFMETALEAITSCDKHLGLGLCDRWQAVIKEAPNEFSSTAYLKFDPNHCISMEKTRIRFHKRNEQGVLVRYDPPDVLFEVY